MSRRRTVGTKKKIALLVSAAAVAGAGAFVMANTSNAAQTPQNATPLSAANSTVCQGLATALGNNQKFIDGQRAAPDAQSEARIANREAVIAQIKVQQKASGCAVGESAQDSQTGGSQAGGAQTGGAQAARPALAGGLRPRGEHREQRQRRKQRHRGKRRCRRLGPPGLQRFDGHPVRRGRCTGRVEQPVPGRNQAEGHQPGQQQVHDRRGDLGLR